MTMDYAIARRFRLSPQQQRLWLLQTDEPRPAFLSRCALRLQGEVDHPALARALGAVVARYEILRTTFPVLAGMTFPLQEIREALPPSLPTVDLRALTPALREAEAGAVCAGLTAPPFDLETAAHLRAAFVRLADGEAELALVLPALCADLPTLETLGAEILAHGASAPPPGEEEPLQLADTAEWQHQLLEGEDTAEGVERWRELWRGSDLSARLDDPIPLDEEPEARGPFAPVSLPISLTVATARSMTADLALAAWQIVLWQSSGERPEQLVGVLNDGRRYAELVGAVGPLARYLPVVVRLRAETTAGALRESIRQACAEAARRQDLFSWDLVAGAETRDRFFPICFQALGPAPSLEAGRLRGQVTRREATLDRFALELVYEDSGAGLPLIATLTLRYDPRRLRRGSAALLAERLSTILQTLSASPEALETPLRDLEILGPAEHLQLLDFAAGPPGVEPEGCLHQRFAAQAARTPERTAVTGAGPGFTFTELDARSNRLAHHLRDLGVGPEMRVAVLLDRSTEAVLALLAVLKSGAAWVPLDPASPADRLGFLLADAGAVLIIATRVTAASLAPETRVRMVLLDEDAAAIASRPDTAPAVPVLPENLAYLIYTSGSTGRPKGVLVSHRAPLNLLAGLEIAALADRTEPLRASLNAPLIFDASVQQLVLLLAGHTLCVVPEAVRTDGAALLAWLREQAVDLFDCTPSQLRLLLAAGLLEAPDPVPGIVFSAGEAMDQTMWFTLGSQQRTAAFNIYGPTECTVDATAWRVGGGRPSIGRPLAGYATFVLDAGLRPVPLGAPGELCIGGTGLARGYLGRPDITAERFLPNPFAAPSGERLYRTGDLVRHRPDGTLEFLGRTDLQVKIRGYRIEPGEIEAALLAHPWVRETVVMARRDDPGSPEQALLIAYVTPTAEAPPDLQSLHAEMQRFLSGRLPAYLVPTAYIPLPVLPLTPNGKVDRRALPPPDRARLSGNERMSPRNPLEATLAAIWAEVLDLDSIGIDDNFFAFGGDSIRSLQVQVRAHERGLHFSVGQVFQLPTVRELAAAVLTEEEPGVQLPSQPLSSVSADDWARLPEEIEDAYPMTMLQTGMLFHTELSPESGMYQDIRSFSVHTRLDLPLLEAVVARLVERHLVLRTGFRLSGFSEPLQLVHRTARIPIDLHDLCGLAEDEQERAIAELLDTEKVRPFDWRKPPLIRIALHLRAEECFQFTLTEHHSLFDGWSVAALLTELFNLYVRGPAALATAEPPPPPALRDYVGLERQALASEEARTYWQRALAGASRSLLPRWPDTAEDGAPLRNEHFGFQLPDAVSEGLRELTRRISVPLKSVLLAIHLKVVATLTGNTDVVTGISSDGRPEVLGADQALGIFVSMLPLRLHLRPGAWLDLVRQVFAAERELLAFRRFPFSEIQRLHGNSMLFETGFNFVHFHVYREIEQGSGVRIGGGHGFEMLEVPLTANFAVDPLTSRLSVNLNCHLNVLSREQIESIAGYYQRALELVSVEPEADHTTAVLLSTAEREELLSAGRPSAQPLAPPDLCVHTLFTEQASLTPNVPALVAEDERLISYRELERRSNQLAHHLLSLGAGPEARVAILLPRIPEAIVAILGVLKAGGAYLPLDPAQPAERLLFMVEDSGASLLITDQAGADRLRASLGLLPVVLVDSDAGLLAAASAEPPRLELAPEMLAYIIYTSGSTGRPKGTMIAHRGLANLAAAFSRGLEIRPGDRFLQFSSLTFDASVAEILPALLAGAELHLPGRDRLPVGADLLALLQRRRITHLILPPSVLAGLPAGELPALRVLTVAGEACPAELADRWTPAFRMVNGYGPTEASVCATMAHLAGNGTKPSIGRPLPGFRAMVVDSFGQPVPVGVPGELWIGGIGLARGYLGRPDRTAAAFVPDPWSDRWSLPGERLYRTGDLVRRLPDGQLDFLGRIDHQIKVRGFRIELGEIEARILQHRSVRAATVVAREDQPGDPRIVAYLVLGEGEDTAAAELAGPRAAELREELKKTLPDYMIPSSFIHLPALPVTSHGKLDRRALPAPATLRRVDESSHVPPRSPTEERLAALWAKLLGLEKVSVLDDFLSLGGHSLLAVQVIAQIREDFGVNLPLRTLYEEATVARLAVAIVQAQAEATDQEALEQALAELDQLSDEEAQATLAHLAAIREGHGIE